MVGELWNWKVWGTIEGHLKCYLIAAFLGAAFFAAAFLGAAFLAGAFTNMSLIPKSVINLDAASEEPVTWRFCSINKALILL